MRGRVGGVVVGHLAGDGVVGAGAGGDGVHKGVADVVLEALVGEDVGVGGGGCRGRVGDLLVGFGVEGLDDGLEGDDALFLWGVVSILLAEKK